LDNKPSTEKVVERIKEKDLTTRLPLNIATLRQKLAQKASQEPKFKFYSLFGLICRKDILWVSWTLVYKNRGAPGVDGITFEDILKQEGGPLKLIQELATELEERRYKPKPVRRVYIPKPDGRMRPLGILTIRDRIVQMAALLILEPIFEADFEECSYGFRPGRSAHQAIDEIAKNIKEGRIEIYDADLKGYFDSIPHDKLMACIRMRITDSSVLKLIRMWLQSSIVEEDKNGKGRKIIKPKEGTPQGGVISPLFSNLYLHWFDKIFHRKDGPRYFANARLIRYADDFVVMARYQSKRLTDYIQYKIENWLGLKINHEKTKIVNVSKGEPLDFLGFTLQKVKSDHYQGEYLKISPKKKAVEKAFDKIRELTGSNLNYLPIPEVIEGINQFLNGWYNYFEKGHPFKTFAKIDAYVGMKLQKHLSRRSQRGFKKPKKETWYRFFQRVGLKRLTSMKSEASRKAVWGKSACTV
jgi:RNA-directed DNA polymerase